MADYIVKRSRIKENGATSATVVVRVDVPVGNNDVGVAWQTALAQARVDQGIDGTTIWPGGVATELDSGAKYEFVFEHKDNKNNAGVVARLEAAVSAAAANEQTTLADLLRFWGKTGTVA